MNHTIWENLQIFIIRSKIWAAQKQMVQAVHDPGWHGKRDNQQENGSFHQRNGLKFKEETSKVLFLEPSFLWYWNVDTL